VTGRGCGGDGMNATVTDFTVTIDITVT